MTVYKGYITVTVLRSPRPYGLCYPPQQNGIGDGRHPVYTFNCTPNTTNANCRCTVPRQSSSVRPFVICCHLITCTPSSSLSLSRRVFLSAQHCRRPRAQKHGCKVCRRDLRQSTTVATLPLHCTILYAYLFTHSQRRAAITHSLMYLYFILETCSNSQHPTVHILHIRLPVLQPTKCGHQSYFNVLVLVDSMPISAWLHMSSSVGPRHGCGTLV